MADNISSKENSGSVSLLAVFPDLGPAADAIDKLRDLGLSDDQMNVISGIPATEAMLGRPHQWTNVPRLAAGGSILGFLRRCIFGFCFTLSVSSSDTGRSASLCPGSSHDCRIVRVDHAWHVALDLPRRVSR